MSNRASRSFLLPRISAAHAVLILITLGILARFVRYLACFPLWGDEAFVAANVFARGPLGLLRPMAYEQVAPYGYLLAVWSSVRALGPSEYALRLPSIIAGAATLFLFYRTAQKCLGGWALVWAAAMLAAAHYPIRHAAECKQYACDLFAAVLIFYSLMRWRKEYCNPKAWRTPALGGSLGLAISMPAVFLVATSVWAMLLHALTATWRGKDQSKRTEGGSVGAREMFRQIVLAAGVPCAVFLLLYFGHLRTAMAAAKQETSLHNYWRQGFPPFEQGLSNTVYWLLETLTGLAFAYPVGGRNLGSIVTVVLFAFGIVTILRKRDAVLACMVLAPFVIGLAAACFRLYPFGGNIRLVLYLAPGICIASGLGLQRVLCFVAKRSRKLSLVGRNGAAAENSDGGSRGRPSAYAFLTGVFAALCFAEIFHSIARPYNDRWDMREREIARWVWEELSLDAELVCLHTDWKTDFEPALWNIGHSAVYLANQKIYYERIRQGRPPNLSSVSRTRPLRVIAWTLKPDHPAEALNAWLDSMRANYEYIGRRRFPFNLGTKFPAMLDVFEFFPKAAQATEAAKSTKEATLE